MVAIAAGVHLLLRACVLAVVLIRYDAVVLASGNSFLRGHDLWLLRVLGKKVIRVFTGTDHRPPYLNRKLARLVDQGSPDALVRQTSEVYRHVGTVERWATAVVAHSASAQFHRRPYVEFLAIGIPFQARGAEAMSTSRRSARSSRVLHCPSDPEARETAVFRSIIASLRDRGHDIELVELSGRPHHEILAAIQQCDFVIDEVYSDTPMGGLAAEAAFFGKPTVVSGYYAPYVPADIPRSMIPPSLYCLPDELPGAIERLVVDHDYRIDLGARAQAYVRTQWRSG